MAIHLVMDRDSSPRIENSVILTLELFQWHLPFFLFQTMKGEIKKMSCPAHAKDAEVSQNGPM